MEPLPSILFVDQDTLYYSVLASFFRKHSLNAGACVDHNYQAIRSLFAEGLPDIVVVSYKSTKPETIKTTVWIKKHYPSVRVVISTQYHTKSTEAISRRAGAQGMIIKSIHSLQQIVAILHAVFKGEKQFHATKKYK